MTRRSRFNATPTISRRRFAGLSAGVLGAAAVGAHVAPTAAQSVDPFAFITTMPETETLGQVAGQPVEEVGPVESDGALWTAMVQVPIKRGQDLRYTCEFDSAWSIMMAYGMDVPLEEQLAAVGIDDRLEPYWEETADGIMIYGGDIGQYFCGDLDTNLVAKAKGSAMAKAFEAKGLVATPVHDRPAIEQAVNLGHPVFFKSTVDFLPWTDAIWNTPEGIQYRVVFSNDHALTVMAYNDTEVVIRDPLGPTSTNERRPFQYRVSWERFLEVFAAQENDGLAISPSGSAAAGASGMPAATERAAIPTPAPEQVELAVGDIAEVADDPMSLSLNVREEASTDSEIIDDLEPRTEVEITGERVEADGYQWYPVEVVDTGDKGFAVAEYLVPADD